MSKAVRGTDRFSPWKPDLPATLELTYYRSDYADDAVARGIDVERVDARTVRRTIQSLEDIRGF